MSDNRCAGCGAPPRPGDKACFYCGTAVPQPATPAVRGGAKTISGNMGEHSRLVGVTLRGNMNEVDYAEDCVIIGNMNTVRRAVRCTVRGNMNKVRKAVDCDVEGSMNEVTP